MGYLPCHLVRTPNAKVISRDKLNVLRRYHAYMDFEECKSIIWHLFTYLSVKETRCLSNVLNLPKKIKRKDEISSFFSFCVCVFTL